MKSKFFLLMVALAMIFAFSACGGDAGADVVDDLDNRRDNSAVMDTNRGSDYNNDSNFSSPNAGSFDDRGETRLEDNRDHDGVVDHSDGSKEEAGGIQDS